MARPRKDAVVILAPVCVGQARNTQLLRDRPDGALVNPLQPGGEMSSLGYQLWGRKYGHLTDEDMTSFETYCKAVGAEHDARSAAEQATQRAQYDAWRAAGGVHNGG